LLIDLTIFFKNSSVFFLLRDIQLPQAGGTKKDFLEHLFHSILFVNAGSHGFVTSSVDKLVDGRCLHGTSVEENELAVDHTEWKSSSCGGEDVQTRRTSSVGVRITFFRVQS
jgi:hypothetical protein